MHITALTVLTWLGVAVAFAFGYALVRGFIANTRKPRETWEPAAVQSGTSQLTAAMGGPAQTIVLYRSNLGGVRTVTLAGKWTLEQVKGETPSPERDPQLTLHK